MNKKNQQSGEKELIIEGYVPSKKGYQPIGDNVTGGHKPDKLELKPVNPPKKK